MSRQTLIIHSGTFKTGSSSIQLFLNRAQHYGHLAEYDVLYPKAGRSLKSIQHGNLVSQLRDDRAFATRNGGWDELVAEIKASGLGTTVVSSEHFSVLDAAQVARIGEIIRAADLDVRWVHYLRDQPGLYNSFYVERMMVLRPENVLFVDQPFEQFRSWSPIDLSFLRYDVFAESIRAGIPDVDLRLRPFTRSLLRGGDALTDFIDTAGLSSSLTTDPAIAAHAQQTNVGSGWKSVETARRFTHVVRAAHIKEHLRGVESRAAIRLRWTQLIRSEFAKATTDVGWNEGSAVYLTDEFRSRLLGDYRADNERAGEIGGFPYAEIVADEPVKPYNIGDYATVSAEDLMTVVTRMMPLLYRPPAEIAEQIEEHRLPEAPPPTIRGLARERAGAAVRRARNAVRRPSSD